MDYSLSSMRNKAERELRVLILILMDYSLRMSDAGTLLNIDCLNPYSNGLLSEKEFTKVFVAYKGS